MTKKEKLIQKIKNNPDNVSFDDLCHAIEMFGFKRKGGVGSHKFYVHNGIQGALNIQERNGKAKSYQVKQFLKIIEEYKLKVV
jgi:predicted RNA binding protein YcfA (HicA-like mRNA interferase family)